MKKLLLFVLSTIVIEASFAQTGAQYYLPMCVGNQTVFQTDPTTEYWGRTTKYTYINTDIIEGELYFVEQGVEYVYENMAPPSVFRNLWMRVNDNGDIVVKAFSESSAVLDSSNILPTELIIFSDNFLTEGYAITQTLSPGETVTDSVVSTHASYDVFNNCIQVREISKTYGVTETIEDSYYAYGIGRVFVNRIVGEIHSDSLDGLFITGCDPVIDTLPPPPATDTCIGEYFEYYVSSIEVDTVTNVVTVDWVFQDSIYTVHFIETYTFQHQGNHLVSIILQCPDKKSSETYYDVICITSSPLGIEDENENHSSNPIYPNPATEVINVSNACSQEANLAVYDLKGRLLKIEHLLANALQQVDVSELLNGIYMITISSNDQVQTQKLIIQR